jgi:leucyl aminopeptidase
MGVEVHFIVAACENMVSGRGLRPGDILTASNGKTIEVNNTDAEGRLTLADALVYAESQVTLKPEILQPKPQTLKKN